MIQVELERVGAGILHQLRVADPATLGRGVEAGDHRDARLGLDLPEPGQVAVPHSRERLDGREVVQRLGEAVRAGLQRPVDLQLLEDDLLLEERRQDDRRRARLLEQAGGGELARERRRRGDDRRAQVEAEVAGAQIDGHASSPVSVMSGRAAGAGRASGSVWTCGHAAVHRRELLVVAPALVDVRLRELRELGRPLRLGAGEDREPGLAGHELADWHRRRGGVELERLAGLGVAGMEPVERPVPALDGVLLVGHRLGHVDPVGDAGAVGDDQGRPRPGIRLEQRLGSLRVVAAHRDLGDVDVAVGPGDGAEILLAAGLAGGRELGDRAARGCLRGLAAGVGVDLRVEDEDVDVPAGAQDVVEAAVADVVRPAIPAHDPDALADEVVGERQQVTRVGAGLAVQPAQGLAESHDPGALRLDLRVGLLVGLEDVPDKIGPDGRRELRDQPSGLVVLGVQRRAACPGRTRRCPRRGSCSRPVPDPGR